ncbi:MAG: S8 family serine peptidase [Shewanellaceae bacterium]|nr:S8 family serine peptidase [Shewanellaceae bacterium]
MDILITAPPKPTISKIDSQQVEFGETKRIQINAYSKAPDATLTYLVNQQDSSLGTATMPSTQQIVYQAKQKAGTDLVTLVVKDTHNKVQSTLTFKVQMSAPKPDLVAISAFESDNKTIRGRIISPAHASANNRDTFTYKIGQNHTISKTFNDVDDYAFVLNDDGTFTFTSHLNYLGEVKVPVVVTSSTGQNETIEASFATEIKQAAFNDPEAHNQWHIHNTGQTNGASKGGKPGHDINIGLLHRQGVTGQGVEVAVLDSSTYIDHKDLSENIARTNSYDFENQDDDPSPSLDKGSTHGTKVTGIIGAVANNHEGGHGVAPGVMLNIFQRPSNLTSKSFKNMIENWLTKVQILNQSFGNPSMNTRKTDREPLIDLFKSTHSYNNGRGLFFVKSAGNAFKQDRQLQKNKSSTSAYLPARNSNSTQKNYLFENTVVAAVTADANQPHAPYSSSGANVFISAPGG